jgi:hypothetical protein
MDSIDYRSMNIRVNELIRVPLKIPFLRARRQNGFLPYALVGNHHRLIPCLSDTSIASKPPNLPLPLSVDEWLSQRHLAALLMDRRLSSGFFNPRIVRCKSHASTAR